MSVELTRRFFKGPITSCKFLNDSQLLIGKRSFELHYAQLFLKILEFKRLWILFVSNWRDYFWRTLKMLRPKIPYNTQNHSRQENRSGDCFRTKSDQYSAPGLWEQIPERVKRHVYWIRWLDFRLVLGEFGSAHHGLCS